MNGVKCAFLCGLAVAALGAGGCTRAQAKVVPEPPPLDVPAPPPRNVEAREPEPPPLPAAPQGPVQTAPLPPRVSTPTQQRAEPAKPDPPKVETPVPAEPPRPVDESRPQGILQTTPAGREAQLEKAIRDMLASATANLSRVAYGSLNGDARTQYDQARRFISQAQDALREKNLVFAENLADKANTLAAQLARR